jgi:catechol 2,3-dioxygenase-like lactoylglutathione lyase family enzyme
VSFGQRPSSARKKRVTRQRALAWGYRLRLESDARREVVEIFESATTHTMIAVKDLEVAKKFYGGTLGLQTFDERHGVAVRYETQGDTWFMVYTSERAAPTETTRMKFEVEDIEVAVKELRDRGVVFEEYVVPGVEPVDGIYTHESGARGAWFKDPEGNILQIGQYN